VWVAGGFL